MNSNPFKTYQEYVSDGRPIEIQEEFTKEDQSKRSMVVVLGDDSSEEEKWGRKKQSEGAYHRVCFWPTWPEYLGKVSSQGHSYQPGEHRDNSKRESHSEKQK